MKRIVFKGFTRRFVGMAIIPYLTEIFEFPHFAIHSAKGLAAFWQHRHLAQKVLEKLAFQSAFMCKVFSSLCDGNLLAL